MERLRVYPAVLSYSDGGAIAVTFPDLGSATSGDNDIDALTNAKDLLYATLVGMIEDGEELPKPSSLIELSLDKNDRTMLVECIF